MSYRISSFANSSKYLFLFYLSFHLSTQFIKLEVELGRKMFQKFCQIEWHIKQQKLAHQIEIAEIETSKYAHSSDFKQR